MENRGRGTRYGEYSILLYRIFRSIGHEARWAVDWLNVELEETALLLLLSSISIFYIKPSKLLVCPGIDFESSIQYNTVVLFYINRLD